jgi:hypothetical protein
MSPAKSHFSPYFKEYFQSSYRRKYKVCNRYKISNITLKDYGLEIDQEKCNLPLVVESDNVVSNPEDKESVTIEKPFCCTHCGSESYKKYGKKNGKQVYKCNSCNRKFVDNMFFERR